MKTLVLLLLGISLAGAALASGLDIVMQEPNLERRSERAMELASTALDQAREAYQAADSEHAQPALEQVGAAVDLARQSLDETGKDARRNPKFFKKTELAVRQLLRRIEALKQNVNFDDQPAVEKLHQHITDVHDELIRNIMGKRK